MNHLYKRQGVLHACEGAQVTRSDYLVWTLCHIDVPANESFMSDGLSANCAECCDAEKRTKEQEEKESE